MEIVSNIFKRYALISIRETFMLLLWGIILVLVLHYSSLLLIWGTTLNNEHLSDFLLNVFFIFIWLFSFFTIKAIIYLVYKYLKSFKSYTFKTSDWPKKWDYQGNIRLENNDLYVTDSQSGCLLKGHYWKNLEMSFKCKFPQGNDDQTIGIIFRAISLSDYLMIQINGKEKKIIPHVRFEGGWETFRLTTYDFNNIPHRDTFFDVKLIIKDEKVELYIANSRILEWNVPTNSDLRSTDDKKAYSDTLVPKIDFRKSYGRIGFRAYQGEGAVIKDLFIKRIPAFL